MITTYFRLHAWYIAIVIIQLLANPFDEHVSCTGVHHASIARSTQSIGLSLICQHNFVAILVRMIRVFMCTILELWDIYEHNTRIIN